MPQTVLEAPDISCDHCIVTIEKAVTRAGARFVSGDPQKKQVTVDYDPAAVSLETIEQAMEEEGYPVRR
jgi:copper chaperone